jgi:hydroxymethylglutaryl-CoA reductase (NADPH)
MKIPSLLLRQLYTFGSLQNTADGFAFSLRNRLSDVTLTRLVRLRVDGEEIPLKDVRVAFGSATAVPAGALDAAHPIPFPLKENAHVSAKWHPLTHGSHDIKLMVEAGAFGQLEIAVKDAIHDAQTKRTSIPYEKDAALNYTPKIVAERLKFLAKATGRELHHVSKQSFEPDVTRGNIENFIGVAQVPIGLAGPLHVKGEHAKGEFLIPLATTEGTLVASYNRGMKVLNLSGGVTCTVSDDCMQRAPVFVFDSAREAREFRAWVNQHLLEIAREAEATSSIAKMLYIDTFLASKFAFLRFNFSTGDAAGQNMTGRATFAACSWILEQVPSIRRFFLESNFATDKKASQVNVMRTRGKRVTAEATIPREVLMSELRVEPESLQYHGGVANVGTLLSGANNNGLHSANGITAMFIATGQDVANVAEGAAGIIYSELTPARDLYISITIPSLIVATHGGGTKLPTQAECLDILGCTGKGKVNKLAEIVAGVVLAGEISLAAAISSLEWVSSHEKYGRNR